MTDEAKSDARGSVSAPGARIASHHAAYSESAMKADMVTLHTMNEMLQNVERHYNDGRMRAFAEHNNDVMKEFNEVRMDARQCVVRSSAGTSARGPRRNRAWSRTWCPPHRFALRRRSCSSAT